jgi:hypothetical protein
VTLPWQDGAPLAAGLTAGVITAAAAGSLGGPLELQDEGVFFVNGQAAATGFPDSPPTGAARQPPGRYPANLPLGMTPLRDAG